MSCVPLGMRLSDIALVDWVFFKALKDVEWMSEEAWLYGKMLTDRLEELLERALHQRGYVAHKGCWWTTNTAKREIGQPGKVAPPEHPRWGAVVRGVNKTHDIAGALSA